MKTMLPALLLCTMIIIGCTSSDRRESTYNQANSLAESGRYQEAINYLRSNTPEGSRDARYHFALGNLYVLLDPALFTDIAIEHFLEAYAQRPDSFRIQRSLGTSFAALDRHERAVRFLEEATGSFEVQRDRESEPFGPLANSYYELGRYHDALAAVERSLEIDPDDAWYHLLRGLILSQFGEVQSLTESFEAAYALEPGNSSIPRQHGLRLIELTLFDAAEKHYERFLSEESEPGGPSWARSGLGLVALLQHQTEAARRHFEIADSLSSVDAETLKYRSFLLYATGDTEAAMDEHIEYRIATLANETVRTDISVSQYLEYYDDDPVFQLIRDVYDL